MKPTTADSSSAATGPRNRPSSSAGPGGRLNSRRYVYLMMGYYIAMLLIRSTTGKTEFAAASPNTGGSTGHAEADIIAGINHNVMNSYEIVGDEVPPEDGKHDPTKEGHLGSDGKRHESHGIQITKVDFEHVETPFIIGLWILCASLAKIVFHMAPRLSHIFPESSLLIVVGVLIGLLLFHTNGVHVHPLTPDTFFFYMLPPIILDAGYFMPNRLFFNNLGTILLFAVIGTLWNTFSIGVSLWGVTQLGWFGMEIPLLQILLFSALISAVDPVAVLAVFEEIHVNEVLYIVVFGESLLNDAVTVVLYHMFEEYAVMGAENISAVEIVKGVASFPVVALGGTAIGIIWGFLTGFLTRFTNHVRVIEPIFVFVMAYLAYLCAETFHMSGILAITFCGITMKNYVEANISQKSHTVVKYAMKMLSSSSETIIFMFLGVSTIHDEHEWNTIFVVATILFCTVYRAIGVVFFTMIANRFRLHTLSFVDQFVMSYGGLRGAVAFALVLLIKDETVHCDTKLRRMFITTTIAVIYFTVFVQGITIKPLVEWLRVKKAEKRKPTMNERIHERLMDHSMSVIEKILGTYGHNNLRNKFKHFDNTYIRPCLIRDLKGAEPKILETYSRLVMQDAMDMMNRSGGSYAQNLNKLSSESMAQLIRNQQYESATTLNPSGSSNHLSPSAAQVQPQPQPDQWNLDLQELEYNLSKKDLSDAKIHHLLEEELFKPNRRQRRLSYSRHAVDDADLVTEPQLNYKAPITFKKMVSHRRVRQRGVGKGDPKSHQLYENRGFSLDEGYNRRVQTGDDTVGTDGGIYFIAGGSSRKYASSLPGDTDFHMDWNERRWSQMSQASCLSDKSYMESTYPQTVAPIARHWGRRYSRASTASANSEFEYTPTIQEMSLPWRRDSSGQQMHSSSNRNSLTGQIPQIVHPYMRTGRRYSRVAPVRKMSTREGESPPQAQTLPWKRDDEEDDEFPVRQNEFPAWSSNKEYMAYDSPTNTYLGALDRHGRGTPTVIGMFKRDSTTSSPGSRRGSIASLQAERTGSPRHSIGSNSSGTRTSFDASGTEAAAYQYQQEPPIQSPSHRPPLRRGSTTFTMSIPEEVAEESETESPRRTPTAGQSITSLATSMQGQDVVVPVSDEGADIPLTASPPLSSSDPDSINSSNARRKIGTVGPGFSGSVSSPEPDKKETDAGSGSGTPKSEKFTVTPAISPTHPTTTTNTGTTTTTTTMTTSASDPSFAQTKL